MNERYISEYSLIGIFFSLDNENKFYFTFFKLICYNFID